jgi:uncharacterized protein YdeI (YjbR/CyaY-like superfamily)
MPSPDPRIDAYIAHAAPFAQPVLAHLRAAVHAAVPEVVETMKWSRPHFLLDGRILCGMSAFKAHCTLAFWAMREAAQAASGAAAGEAMGQFGRITRVSDLPSTARLDALVRDAAKASRQEAAAPVAPRRKPARPALPVPDDLRDALAARAGAAAAFAAFTAGRRREYVEWIVEAKRPETRAKRLAQAVAWVAEGRHRNWKYETGC